MNKTKFFRNLDIFGSRNNVESSDYKMGQSLFGSFLTTIFMLTILIYIPFYLYYAVNYPEINFHIIVKSKILIKNLFLRKNLIILTKIKRFLVRIKYCSLK